MMTLDHEREAQSEGPIGHHTPGPWAVMKYFPDKVVPLEDAGKACGGSMYESEDLKRYGRIIASAEHNTYSDFAHEFSEAEARANARLIAAAPDMLAALKDTREFILMFGGSTEQIDDAIAKATMTAPTPAKSENPS